MGPADFLDQCPFSAFTGSVFRAIYTSFPTRNLYSDIGFREGDPDYEIAMFLADSDASIDFSKPQQSRPFQYSEIDDFLRNYTSEVIPRVDLIYPLVNVQKGRFSDGSFGVFYAALEEQTSLAEVAFHFVDECIYDIKMSPDVFLNREVDKRIVQLDITDSRIFDFRPFRDSLPQLTAESLEYCQSLGELVKKRGIPFVLTPSARAKSGTCTPIFAESAIPSTPVKTIRYYHFKFDKDNGLKIKKSDILQTNWVMPTDWQLPLSN